MTNKIDFNKYGESLFMIILGIGFFIWTRGSVENYNPSNTTFVKGVLSESPRLGSQGGDYDYVSLEIKGLKDSYRFSKCSLNDRIEKELTQMEPGDSIYLYAMKKWSTKTITLKSNPSKTYRICEAWSPKLGYFIKFSRFNSCSHWEKNTFFPILSGILVLLGFLRVRKKILHE